jgi:hypothetical protein
MSFCCCCSCYCCCWWYCCCCCCGLLLPDEEVVIVRRGIMEEGTGGRRAGLEMRRARRQGLCVCRGSGSVRGYYRSSASFSFQLLWWPATRRAENTAGAWCACVACCLVVAVLLLLPKAHTCACSSMNCYVCLPSVLATTYQSWLQPRSPRPSCCLKSA